MAFHISDTHFNHENIIKYCNRPFKSVEEMNEYIIEQWNRVVGVNDVVYHHGDFALGISTHDCIDILKRLNGQKVLICGNLDVRSDTWYKNCGFNRVVRKQETIKDKYLLTHVPRDIGNIPRGVINIHGHVQDRSVDKFNKPDYYLNVACDVLDYTPIWVE